MHVFSLYFIKGEKIRFSYFNWYLYFHSLTLWKKIIISIDIICLKWTIISIGIKMLFSFFLIGIKRYFFDIKHDTNYVLKSPLIDFVFILDKKGENIVFIVLVFCWFFVLNKMGRKIYCFGFYPFVDDWQKGGERFWVWVFICIFMVLHILSLIGI